MPRPKNQYLGRILTKIVGTQYTRANARPGEVVHIDRDLENEYDANAIKVSNDRFERLGYLPKEMSAWMAPLLDQGKIYLQAKIPADARIESGKRHLGVAVRLSVFLEQNGLALLQPNLSPKTEDEVVREIVRNVYQHLLDFPDPEVILGVGKRLEKVGKQSLDPETRLLLTLFPSKAEELEITHRQTLAERIGRRLKTVRIGEPVHYKNLTLFPIHKTNGKPPKYVLLSEATEKGYVEVEEISAEGAVGELLVRNHGHKPVLIPEGEILCGAKQNRVVNISLLVAADAAVRVPVSCVEQHRWHYSGEKTFKPTHVAHSKLRKTNLDTLFQKRVETGEARSDQNAVWGEVSDHLHKCQAKSDTDSITDGYAQLEDRLQGYREHCRLPAETAGVIACTGETVLAMDLFHSHKLFEKYWDRLSASYYNQLVMEFGEEPPAPAALTAQLLERIKAHIQLCDPAIGLGSEFMVKDADLIGNGIWHEDEIAHISIFTEKK